MSRFEITLRMSVSHADTEAEARAVGQFAVHAVENGMFGEVGDVFCEVVEVGDVEPEWPQMVDATGLEESIETLDRIVREGGPEAKA